MFSQSAATFVICETVAAAFAPKNVTNNVTNTWRIEEAIGGMGVVGGGGHCSRGGGLGQ